MPFKKIGLNVLNRYKFLFLFLFLFLALLVISCGKKQDGQAGRTEVVENDPPENEVINTHTAEYRRIDEYFSNLHDKGAFNGVVLFADKGKPVYKKAFGYANFKTREQLNVNSAFQLASVSKQFTAFAIMLLKQEGKLTYSDSLRKFFPGFPYGNITVRQLLTHNSGLPNYMYFAEDYWTDKSVTMTNNDMIEMLKKYQPKEYFQPGRTFLYSNTGYALLASIVEKVSGMEFQKFMKTRVFDPLKMHNTYIFDYKHQAEMKSVAMGYEPGRRPAEYSYQNGIVGDKGVYSTVGDLLKWDKALYEGKLVGKPTLEEAFTPAYNRPMAKNYGFGWRIKFAENREKIVYHGGWWKGYRSYLVRMIDSKRTIIVLINSASHVPFHLDDLQQLF